MSGFQNGDVIYFCECGYYKPRIKPRGEGDHFNLSKNLSDPEARDLLKKMNESRKVYKLESMKKLLVIVTSLSVLGVGAFLLSRLVSCGEVKESGEASNAIVGNAVSAEPVSTPKSK